MHRCMTNHSMLMHRYVYITYICTCIYLEMQCSQPAHWYLHTGVQQITAHSCIHVYIFTIYVYVFIQKCNVENLLIDIYTQVWNELQHTHAYICIYLWYMYIYSSRNAMLRTCSSIYTHRYATNHSILMHIYAYIYDIYVHVFIQTCNIENLLIDTYTQVWNEL